mmetsp:Transcript_67679/g.218625  ORF Transcript_67679/g.218625 Transcript_67679/m.218625 type:complete len:440 (+) Transcript_67679:576-1895(+)
MPSRCGIDDDLVKLLPLDFLKHLHQRHNLIAARRQRVEEVHEVLHGQLLQDLPHNAACLLAPLQRVPHSCLEALNGGASVHLHGPELARAHERLHTRRLLGERRAKGIPQRVGGVCGDCEHALALVRSAHGEGGAHGGLADASFAAEEHHLAPWQRRAVRLEGQRREVAQRRHAHQGLGPVCHLQQWQLPAAALALQLLYDPSLGLDAGCPVASAGLSADDLVHDHPAAADALAAELANEALGLRAVQRRRPRHDHKLGRRLARARRRLQGLGKPRDARADLPHLDLCFVQRRVHLVRHAAKAKEPQHAADALANAQRPVQEVTQELGDLEHTQSVPCGGSVEDDDIVICAVCGHASYGSELVDTRWRRFQQLGELLEAQRGGHAPWQAKVVQHTLRVEGLEALPQLAQCLSRIDLRGPQVVGHLPGHAGQGLAQRISK